MTKKLLMLAARCEDKHLYVLLYIAITAPKITKPAAPRTPFAIIVSLCTDISPQRALRYAHKGCASWAKLSKQRVVIIEPRVEVTWRLLQFFII